MREWKSFIVIYILNQSRHKRRNNSRKILKSQSFSLSKLTQKMDKGQL